MATGPDLDIGSLLAVLLLRYSARVVSGALSELRNPVPPRLPSR